MSPNKRLLECFRTTACLRAQKAAVKCKTAGSSTPEMGSGQPNTSDTLLPPPLDIDCCVATVAVLLTLLNGLLKQQK